MLFRTQSLEPQAYAGFKKCLVTRVPTRAFAPLGSEFPEIDHGEVEIIAVPPRLRSLSEEWLEANGGTLQQLRSVSAYGHQDYLGQLRPGTYLDRLPDDQGFKQIPGFESWTRSSIEAHVKTKSIVGFMMPRRLVFNQAKGTCAFDFEYRLDTRLPNNIFSIDVTKKSEVKFVSPRPAGPGVLEKLPPPAPANHARALDANLLWWAKPGKFAGMVMPHAAELPALAAQGVAALVTLGHDLDAAAVEAAGMRYLGLPMPDEHVADEASVQLLASVCNQADGAIAICGDDQQAVGTMLGIGLLTDGHGVKEALEMLESASPAALESSGQIEHLYAAAMMLGIDIE